MSIPRLFCAFVITLAGSSNAALVNISANTLAAPARTIVTSGGVLLPVGNAVRIGAFPVGAPVITSNSTFASVNALFVPIGENPSEDADGINGPLTISAAQGAGKYAGTINSVDNADSRFAEGTAIYIFIVDVPYSNLAAATEWAIFRDAAWTIPGTSTRTLTTSQIDVQSEMVVGTQSATNLRLAPIPEPSAAVLGLLGLAFSMRRRRR